MRDELTPEIAANLGLGWPAPLCACGCGESVDAYISSTDGEWKWRKYVLTSKKQKGHSPKRSVRWDVPTDFRKPADLLRIAHRAYLNGAELSNDLGLKHAVVICLPYIGGFRIQEALPLKKSQFKEVSVKGHQFAVIEGAIVEKSSGKTLDRPIVPDDLMYLPVKAWLSNLSDGGFVLPGNSSSPMTTANAEIIVNRASEGKAWPHMFRSVRTSFLRREFSPPEIAELMGWSSGEGAQMVSWYGWYGQGIWEKYAPRLIQTTRDYWVTEEASLSNEIREWIDSLAR